MLNYCTECGAKIEQNFKFCPNCGSELNLSNTLTSPNSQTNLEAVEILICSNCGDENALDSNVCHTCGVKLDDAKKGSSLAPTNKKSAQPNSSGKTKVRKNHRDHGKTKNESPISSEKKLERKKIFIIVGISVIIIGLILIASGVINISENRSVPTEVVEQNQSPGIDLNSINKINELKIIVENDPNNKNALLDLANLRFDSGFFSDAAKSYEQFLNIDPKNADARIDLAVCYYNLQQFDKAEGEILNALKYAPNHQIGYLNLGVIYLAKQEIEKAKEWFKKTVDLDPNSDIGKKAQSLLQSH